MNDPQYEIHIVFRGDRTKFSPQHSTHIAATIEFYLRGKGVEFEEVVVVK